MSDEPHLPGYSVDDDDPHGEPPISEPDSPDDVILVASSAGARDAIAANTTVSPSSQPVSTQPTPTPPAQQQAEERGLRDTNTASTNVPTTSATTTATTPVPEHPAVDDFADPKIASLHAIFPDYDAALL